MIDFSNCQLEKLSVHEVGNKTKGENLFLSKSETDVSDVELKRLLLQFFLPPFSQPEFYTFTFTNEDFKLNPMFQFASRIFESLNLFHPYSVSIAKHLYELSVHPNIKPGDFFAVYFTNITLDNESVSALGIFKSENRQSFLKLESGSSDFVLRYDEGINIEKLDKGCLIFNMEQDAGYRVCLVDRSNKSGEAHYWKELFLMVKPCKDDYHHTRQFLEMTKDYITDRLPDDFEVTKPDQIDVLNRSIDYFKKRDNFERGNFEKEVLQDPDVINSFRKFDENYRTINDIASTDSFGISAFAVKKQNRVFKSVLKLDKNFHIYIHGDKDLIERGVDEEGRKYYKIYYQQEF